MWEIEGMRSLLAAASLALFASASFACSSETNDSTTSDDSNLDTSGCSGVDSSSTQGAVTVSAARPPTNRCWNIDDGGLRVSYSWTQKNDSNSQKPNVGFWVGLNGAGEFQKADSTSCRAQAQSGMGHDTSGDQYFSCTAYRSFAFERTPAMKGKAYGGDGHRVGWAVEVAVALDDKGNWDSLGGANYRFTF